MSNDIDNEYPPIFCIKCGHTVPHSLVQRRNGDTSDICPSCKAEDENISENLDNIFGNDW